MDKQKISFDMGLRLKDLREARGLSYQGLADTLFNNYGIKISKDSLRDYEISSDYRSKAKSLPNLGMRTEYLYVLADFYKVSVDYLLGFSPIASTDVNIRILCEYTGLTEGSVRALRHDLFGKKTWKSSIINFLISEFYVSVLAVNIWNKLKDSALEADVLHGRMEDILQDRRKYNKWRFLSVCEDLYDNIEKEIDPLLKDAAKKEAKIDLEEMQHDAEEQLLKIRAVRAQNEEK